MMRRSRGYFRAGLGLVAATALMAALSSCSRDGQAHEEARVKLAFDTWKVAMLNQQTDRAMLYIPHHVDDYFAALNAPAVTAVHPSRTDPPPSSVPAPPPSDSPGVDLLVRTALERKVPADLRGRLTLDLLLQRIADRHLLNSRDIEQLNLGRVSVNGNRASAELYYQGSLTALRLPFVKEGNDWKIDILAVLPYVELLMRVDRAIKGETEAQQVEQLVSKLPSL